MKMLFILYCINIFCYVKKIHFILAITKLFVWNDYCCIIIKIVNNKRKVVIVVEILLKIYECIKKLKNINYNSYFKFIVIYKKNNSCIYSSHRKKVIILWGIKIVKNYGS